MGYYCKDCRNNEDFIRDEDWVIYESRNVALDSNGDEVDVLDYDTTDSECSSSGDVLCAECSEEASYDDREVISFDEDGEPVFKEDKKEEKVSSWKKRFEEITK